MRYFPSKRIKECVEWSDCSVGVLENNTPAWFVVDQVYVGVYNKDLDIFCMADDRGFRCCDVAGCAPVGAAREIASYPKHGERVAVEIPQLPCIVTGTFNMKYLEAGAIDTIPAIELDPIYDFGYVSGAIAWSKVFSWYKVPEIPSYLCYDKSNIVEMPYSNEDCCKEECGECDEDILINNEEDDIIINDEEDISEIAKFNSKKESKMKRTVRRVRESYNYFPAGKYSKYPSIDLFENLAIHYIPIKNEYEDEDEEYEEDDFFDYDSDLFSISIIVEGDGKYRFEARGDFQEAHAEDFETLCEIIEENAYANMDDYTYSDAVLSAESIKAVKKELKEVEEGEGLKGLLRESKKNTPNRVREAAKNYTIQWSAWDESKGSDGDWSSCDPINFTAKNDDEALAFALKLAIIGNVNSAEQLLRWSKTIPSRTERDFEKLWAREVANAYDSENIADLIDAFISVESKIKGIDLQTNNSTSNIVIDSIEGPNGVIYEFGSLDYLG